MHRPFYHAQMHVLPASSELLLAEVCCPARLIVLICLHYCPISPTSPSSLPSPPLAVPLDSRPNPPPLPPSLPRYLSTHAPPPPVSNPPCKGVIITKQGSAFTFGRNVSGQLGLGASSVFQACARACTPGARAWAQLCVYFVCSTNLHNASTHNGGRAFAKFTWTYYTG